MHAACVLQLSQRAFLLISYFRRNSSEVSRSQGHLGNKSYQFAPMATQSTTYVGLRCIRRFVEVIVINYPNIN